MAETQTFAVTGVATGIGAELCRILKEGGHRVIGLDVKETAENIDRFIQIDLNDPDSITAAANALDEPIDGLCNNAGVSPIEGRETLILQVNFLGQRDFTEQVLPRIKPGGAIVNMASRAGHGWMENLEQVKRLAALTSKGDLPAFAKDENINATRAYNLTKEAILLWTMSITEPLFARDLRAVSLSPGGISTGLLDDFRRAFGDAVEKNTQRAGRPGQPAEVAEIAAFALSRQAYWLKGTDIPIDGGIGAFNMTDRLGLSVLNTGI